LPTAKLKVKKQKSNFVTGALEPATFIPCTYESNEKIDMKNMPSFHIGTELKINKKSATSYIRMDPSEAEV
jgi:hypothetical protein